MGTLALAWVRARSGLTAAPVQVDGWIEAATFELTPADMDEVANAIERTRAYQGPANP